MKRIKNTITINTPNRISKKSLKISFLVVIMMLVPCIAFAQTAQITLLTNKQSYATNDTISISGTISQLGSSNSAVLQIFNPFNVLVQIGTVPVASDGTFHYSIKAEGQPWSNDGSYSIKVIYVSTPILATTTTNITFKSSQVQSSQVTQTQPSTVSPTQTTSTQNNTQTITPSNQIPVEEQIRERIALANKLKEQLDQNTTIPFWVKDDSRKWHDGTIDNTVYRRDIQYLVTSGLVKTNEQITSTNTFEHIPSWLKDVAGWWSQGLVSDSDYTKSIQFLLDEKIIK